MLEMTPEQLLADHQGCHSSRQIDTFILAECGGTPYGQYKQCLRELKTRHGTLLDLDDDIASQRRELRQRERRLAETLTGQADVQREYERFLAHARALKEQVGELTAKRRAELDDAMWVHQLTLAFALDMATTGSLGRGTAESLFAFPPEMREAVLLRFKDREDAQRWLQTAEPPRPRLAEDSS